MKHQIRNKIYGTFFRILSFTMKDEENYNIVIDKIASKLKKLRIEKGFTSYENFAYQNDLPRVQYWRMEKGTNFTIKNLLKILEIHKISIEEFFNNDFDL